MNAENKEILKKFGKTLCAVLIFMINLITSAGCLNYAQDDSFYYIPAIITILTSALVLGMYTKNKFLS